MECLNFKTVIRRGVGCVLELIDKGATFDVENFHMLNVDGDHARKKGGANWGMKGDFPAPAKSYRGKRK